jgi:hypothetical protein
LDRHLQALPLNEGDRALLTRLIHICYQQDLWLAQGQGDEPTYYTTVYRAGKYHLRAFARELEIEPKVYETGIAEDAIVRPWGDRPLDFCAAFREVTPRSTHDVARDGITNSLPTANHDTIGSFLYSLVEEAGVTHVPIAPTDLMGSVAQLLAAIGKHDLTAGIRAAPYTLDDVRPRALTRMRDLLLSKETDWPRQSRPYALLVFLADRIRGEFVHSIYGNKAGRLVFCQPVARSGASETKGPFVVLGTFAEDAQGGCFAPIRAAALPVLSEKRWLPVESDHERQVGLILLRFADDANRDGRQLAIHKPMHPLGFGGIIIRPDFIISQGVKRYFVEVLGYADPNYLQKKKDQGEVLAKHGRYYAYHGYRTKSLRAKHQEELNLVDALTSWLQE